MADVINDRDTLLIGSPQRANNPLNADILLQLSTPSGFRVVNNTGTPSTITITANLISLVGTVTFTAVGATITDNRDNTATLAYLDMAGDSATITAQLNSNGEVFTSSVEVGKIYSGATFYTWVKYADSAAGVGLSDDPTGKAYIGFAYNKATATESNIASDYAFSLIKGTDGQPGGQGADGQTLYTWIKYSDFSDGTGLYDTPTASTQYLGIAVNKTTSTESTNKVDYVWSKFRGDQGVPGNTGTPGATGDKTATVYLYQYAPAAPAKPTGTSGYTWATAVNSTYSANDGWSVVVPTNPGGPNTRLYVASVNITASGNTASTVVSYSNSSVAAWTQNGADGVSGVQSATAIVYQWAASIPTGPIGSGTYTWSNGTYAAPSGWSLVPPNPPSQGISLWAARVNIVDSAKNATTEFNWASASIYVAGSSGANGSAGPSGASFVIAYAASTSISSNTAPPPTTGKNSVPETNSGGIVGTYTKTVPALAEGQRMFQVDGIYDPTTNLVTWSVPYWSVFKVGSLSAIVVNTGNLTVTGTVSDASGNWSIDSNGKMTAKSFELSTSDNQLILQSGIPLSRQTATSPNFVPSVRQWKRWTGGAVPLGGSDNTANGEYIHFPASSDSKFVETDIQLLPYAETYTLSCLAISYGQPGVLAIDIIGSPNLFVRAFLVQPPVGSLQQYVATFTLPGGTSGVVIRCLTGNANQVEVADIKLETGYKATAWSDNVITPGNAAMKVFPDSITNTQFGGDLYSSNWNGVVGPGGAGWLLQRTGTFYAGDVRLRGNIAGGSFNGYAWPAAGLTGYYVGAEGALWGNPNNGSYIQITATGNIYTPTFRVEDGQVSIKSADSGQRTEIDKNGTRVYAPNGQMVVRIGVW